MKTSRNLLAVSSLLLTSSLFSMAQAPKIAWELSKGIKAPESAYYHEKSGNIYLSQVGEAVDSQGWRRFDLCSQA